MRAYINQLLRNLRLCSRTTTEEILFRVVILGLRRHHRALPPPQSDFVVDLEPIESVWATQRLLWLSCFVLFFSG